jgi:hypothetical protein
VTSDGSAYARFRRALDQGRLAPVITAAAELPRIGLDDALEVCVLMARESHPAYERAAVRWIGRFCVERPDVTLEDVDHARAAFQIMRRDPERALGILQTLCA